MMCQLLSAVFSQQGKDEMHPTSFDFILETVVNAHCLKSGLNIKQCQSTECLLEILCQFKAGLKFPQHLKVLGKDNERSQDTVPPQT